MEREQDTGKVDGMKPGFIPDSGKRPMYMVQVKGRFSKLVYYTDQIVPCPGGMLELRNAFHQSSFNDSMYTLFIHLRDPVGDVRVKATDVLISEVHRRKWMEDLREENKDIWDNMRSYPLWDVYRLLYSVLSSSESVDDDGDESHSIYVD